jgi:hypothetical protein
MDKGKPDQCRLKVVRKLSGGANRTSTEEQTKPAPPGETERKKYSVAKIKLHFRLK